MSPLHTESKPQIRIFHRDSARSFSSSIDRDRDRKRLPRARSGPFGLLARKLKLALVCAQVLPRPPLCSKRLLAVCKFSTIEPTYGQGRNQTMRMRQEEGKKQQGRAHGLAQDQRTAARHTGQRWRRRGQRRKSKQTAEEAQGKQHKKERRTRGVCTRHHSTCAVVPPLPWPAQPPMHRPTIVVVWVATRAQQSCPDWRG